MYDNTGIIWINDIQYNMSKNENENIRGLGLTDGAGEGTSRVTVMKVPLSKDIKEQDSICNEDMLGFDMLSLFVDTWHTNMGTGK